MRKKGFLLKISEIKRGSGGVITRPASSLNGKGDCMIKRPKKMVFYTAPRTEYTVEGSKKIAESQLLTILSRETIQKMKETGEVKVLCNQCYWAEEA